MSFSSNMKKFLLLRFSRGYYTNFYRKMDVIIATKYENRQIGFIIITDCAGKSNGRRGILPIFPGGRGIYERRGKEFGGRGRRIATTSLRTGLAMTWFLQGAWGMVGGRPQGSPLRRELGRKWMRKGPGSFGLTGQGGERKL